MLISEAHVLAKSVNGVLSDPENATVLWELVGIPYPRGAEVHLALARNPETPAVVLGVLAGHVDERVRELANRNLMTGLKC